MYFFIFAEKVAHAVWITLV